VRLTDPRRRLLGVLAAADRPLTLPEILERDDGLTQSSAYPNLAEPDELGVVDRVVTTGDHSRFELAADITDHHHHHLVCERCGRVEDVELDPDVERLLDAEGERIGDAVGFSVDAHRLDLLGTCGSCAGAASG
jgi:Fe2+ or Zn2+ uptake regulation protein